jgi:hypothetical protein
MARGQSHGLGFGNGSIIDYGDGIIEYRQTGKLLPAFKVQIADVTGFSVRKATRQDRKNGARVAASVCLAGQRDRTRNLSDQLRNRKENRSMDSSASIVSRKRPAERASGGTARRGPGQHRGRTYEARTAS